MTTQTQVKHTPGPWIAFDDPKLKEEGLGCTQIIDSVGTQIAIVEDRNVSPEANANLIAAAPQMYALIQRAINILQRHAPPDGLTDHEAMSEFYGLFDGPEQRAAMNKAEGRS